MVSGFGAPLNAAARPAAEPCPLCGGPARTLYSGTDLLLGGELRYHYLRCTRCGADYQSPLPDADVLKDFYPPEYLGHAEPARLRQPSRLHRAVLTSRYGYADSTPTGPMWSLVGHLVGLVRYRDEIRAEARGALLDIGCGNGKFLLKMARLGWQVTGVDTSVEAVAACRAAGVEAYAGQLDKLDLAAEAYDLITLRHVIEHVAQPERLVAQAVRLLRPGGRLVIRTPNANALGRRWFGAHWYANDIPRHLILYNRENLCALAGRYGLRLRRYETFTTPKIVLNSWDYLRGVREVSKRRPLRRLIARGYVLLAAASRRGDELFLEFGLRET